MRLKPLALGATLGLCVVSTASAQSVPAAGAKRAAELGLQLSLNHDSNISHSNPLIASSRGLVPEDYTFRPAATFSIVQPLGRQILFLQGSAGYDFHQENKKLDRQRANLAAGAAGAVGICQGALQGGYNAGQSELEELDGAVATNFRETISETVTAGCGRPRGVALTIAGGRQDVKNSATRQSSADHTSDTAAVSLGYGNQSFGKASVVYTYSDQEYPNRLNFDGSFGGGYSTTGMGLTYEKAFGSKATVKGGVSSAKLKRDLAPTGVAKEFTSNNFDALVTYALTGRIKLTASRAKAITPSNRVGKLYDISTTSELLASYRLGSRFTLSAGGSEAEVNSNVDTSILGPVVTRSRNRAVYGSLLYRQSQRATLVFDVRQEERETNLPSYDYSNTHVGLTLNVTY